MRWQLGNTCTRAPLRAPPSSSSSPGLRPPTNRPARCFPGPVRQRGQPGPAELPRWKTMGRPTWRQPRPPALSWPMRKPEEPAGPCARLLLVDGPAQQAERAQQALADAAQLHSRPSHTLPLNGTMLVQLRKKKKISAPPWPGCIQQPENSPF